MQQLFSNIPNSTLHELFADQARQNPDKVALVDQDISLTYHELDVLTNRLANYLSRYHIRDNDAVGVLMEKCYEYIVACIAILKAGGAYLHLELAYPGNFLQQIFTDAAPNVIITKQKYQDKVAPHPVATLYIDVDNWQDTDATPQPAQASGSSIAIIGYSSGTTGQPKGVPVSHQATIYTYFRFWEELEPIQAKDRFAYTTFITWDALNPLIMGQTGYIVPDEIAFDPPRLLDFFAEHGINHTVFTPSLLACIVQTVAADTIHRQLQNLNVVWVGGEITTQQLVNHTLQILPHLYLVNNYGPTECFVITQGQLRANDPATPSICAVGKVLEGMEVLILDESRQPVAFGEVGELYGHGPCLADGYLNNPELTRQKFVSINGKTFFKTGDSAKFLADGRLVILGRLDGMIKIRSYNVNLLAIEEILKRHPHIADCVVVAYGDEGEDKYLVAYLIRSEAAAWQIDQQTLNCPELANYLNDFLPPYMIPRIYIELNRFPIHPISQKLDKASLPRPTYHKNGRTEAIQFGDSAITNQEQITLNLLKEILPQNNIKKSDNFFEIGLHSLLAAQFATRVKHSFGVDLSVASIYEHCTAQDLVAYINNGGHNGATIPWRQDVVLEDTIVSAAQSTVFSPDSRAVLLTGATGFVGVFLLAELLRVSPHINVYCLLRSTDRWPTLIEKLKFYQLWTEGFEERIIPVIGDLEKRYFGWSQPVFEQHAEAVEAIFHAGAWVNMVYPYHRLKATNVEGTREIIRLASCQVNKPLYHISTLGIFPSGNVSVYRENDQIDPLIERLRIGYAQSKWVAEKLVWQAVERGLPAQIYRLGNMGPDTQTFFANDKDTVMLLLDTCKTLKLAPHRDDWFFEYTPVDFVAKAIVQTALGGNSPSNVYHISSPHLVRANDLFSEMKRQGHIDQIIDFERWLQHLRDAATQNIDARYTLLEQSLQVEDEFLLDEEPFDTSLFVAQMEKCLSPLPRVDETYLMQSVYPSPSLYPSVS